MPIIVGYLAKKQQEKVRENVENYRKLLGFMLLFLIKQNEGAENMLFGTAK